MRLLVIVNSFQQGGAEHSALKLAGGFANDGHQAAVLAWNDNLDFFTVPSEVERIKLPEMKELQIFLGRLFPGWLNSRIIFFLKLATLRFRAKKYKPDCIVVFESLIGVISCLSLISAGIPMVISERIPPDSNVHDVAKIAKKWRPWIYKHGAVCSVQTKGFQEWVENNWGVASVVTPNHLTKEYFFVSTQEKSNTVVCVGRLDSQKNLETLIHAWSLVETRLKNWNLKIFGRGEINSFYFLNQKLKNRNLEFNEPTPNVKDEIAKSKIAISVSNYEGFPNFVLESMALGTPVISSISSDIILEFERRDALLLTDMNSETDIAEKIIYMIQNIDLQSKIANNALSLAREFSWPGVREHWYEAVNLAIKKKGVSLFKSS